MHPEWNIFDYFVANDVQNVLRKDATNTTRPMSQYVESQDAIAALFDKIAYDKCNSHLFTIKKPNFLNRFFFWLVSAGAVIRMFMHALGENTFRKGLKYYLGNK